MTPTVSLAMVVGALAGLGIFLVVRGLVPARPALGATLEHLHATNMLINAGLRGPHATATGSNRSALTSWLKPPIVELTLIGQSIDRYVIEKIVFPLCGLLLPICFNELLAISGTHLAWYLPTAVALAIAVGMFFLVDVNIRQRAALARGEFRRAIAAYLMLVGLVRYGGAGAVESLESAARVGDGWVFDRIRQALEDARYANESPWSRLRQVSIEIGVPDLGDVGDIMSLAGDQGVQVYQTLLARAQSLRVALRTSEAQRAAAATTFMYIPTTMLLMVFLVLVGYPAFSRITG